MPDANPAPADRPDGPANNFAPASSAVALFLDGITTASFQDAVRLATRNLPRLAQPDFLPDLLALLSGASQDKIKVQLAHAVLASALDRLPPQQLGPGGLSLALLLLEIDVKSFVGRYYAFLDAAFFDHAEAASAAIAARPDLHPDLSGQASRTLGLLLHELARLWAANTLAEPLNGLLRGDPLPYLGRLVNYARRPLPAEVVRLAPLARYFARADDDLLARAALCALLLASAIKLCADYPTAEVRLLADLLRFEGARQVRLWAEEAHDAGRSEATTLFANAVCWLTEDAPEQAGAVVSDRLAEALSAQAKLLARGRASVARGAAAAARRLFHRAFATVLPLPPPTGRSEPLLELAALALDAGDLIAAAAQLGLAERYGAAQEDAARYAILRANLTRRQGDTESALQFMAQAVTAARPRRKATTNPQTALKRLRHAAAAAQQRGDRSAALTLHFNLLILLDAQGHDDEFIITHGDYMQLLAGSGDAAYEAETLLLRGQLLLKLHRPLPAVAALQAALGPARRQERADLQRFILSALANGHHLLHEHDAAAETLAALRELAARPTDSESARRLPTIGSVAAEVARLEAAAGSTFDLPAVQSLLRALPGTALVYLEARPPATLALLLSADHAEALALPVGMEQLAALLLALRAEAPRAEGELRGFGWAEQFFNQESFATTLEHTLAAVGAQIMAPLHERLTRRGSSSLIFVADAFFAPLPLHAAPLAGRNLLDFYRVGYAPSAGALAAALDHAAAAVARHARDWSALVGSARRAPVVAAAGLLGVLGATFGAGTVVLSGAADDLPAAALLHVHVHSRADDVAGLPSGLATASAGAILAVLALCEGGEIASRHGMGGADAVSSLLRAGIPALLAAPWRLSEPATSLLLAHFYRELAAGLPIAAALRTAQLWLRDLARAAAVRALDDLAGAARHAVIAPPLEAVMGARLLADQARAYQDEGAAIRRLLAAFADGREQGTAALVAATRTTSAAQRRSRELAAALLRELDAGASAVALTARLRALLEKPFASPYYWGGLQAIGATLETSLSARSSEVVAQTNRDRAVDA